jgi:hypothetical protein
MHHRHMCLLSKNDVSVPDPKVSLHQFQRDFFCRPWPGTIREVLDSDRRVGCGCGGRRRIKVRWRPFAPNGRWHIDRGPRSRNLPSLYWSEIQANTQMNDSISWRYRCFTFPSWPSAARRSIAMNGIVPVRSLPKGLMELAKDARS